MLLGRLRCCSLQSNCSARAPRRPDACCVVTDQPDKEKGRATARPFFNGSPPREISRPCVARLLALRALGHFKADLLAFLQGLESRHVDRREVREQIFAAAIRCNETEPLGVVEPLDC